MIADVIMTLSSFMEPSLDCFKQWDTRRVASPSSNCCGCFFGVARTG